MPVRDLRRPEIDGPEVESTDAPVVTGSVPVAGVTPASADLTGVVAEAFDAHASQLKAFALAAVRDQDLADDLVQETFIRFVKQARQSVPDNIPGWLHRVCANLIVTQGRRQNLARRMTSFLVDRTATSVSPEEHALRTDETARLRYALAKLEPTQARVALLLAAAGYSPAEIARMIGRSRNATSIYICRSRVRLREILSATTDGD